MSRPLLAVLALSAALLTGTVLASPGTNDVQPDKKITWAIVVHGGAGGAPPQGKSSPNEPSLRAYLDKGREMLAKGASAVDTCEKVMNAFESDGGFNCGKGAVFTAEKKHSLDSAIMDGSNLKVGAVAGVRTIKHPVSAARLVMDKTKHVMLIRDGAEEFAAKMGLEIVPNSYFDGKRGKSDKKDGEIEPEDHYGTCGCVCLDQKGNLAAATSTGGLSNVMPGRVGDAPICGAGTYANNLTCAVSGTGVGEEYIRNNIAHTISALMQYKGLTAKQAADEAINNILKKNIGGVIVVSHTGETAFPFNTAGMGRGRADSSGLYEVGFAKELSKEKGK